MLKILVKCSKLLMLVYMIVVHMLHMYVCVVIVFDKKILQISVKREIN